MSVSEESKSTLDDDSTTDLAHYAESKEEDNPSHFDSSLAAPLSSSECKEASHESDAKNNMFTGSLLDGEDTLFSEALEVASAQLDAWRELSVNQDEAVTALVEGNKALELSSKEQLRLHHELLKRAKAAKVDLRRYLDHIPNAEVIMPPTNEITTAKYARKPPPSSVPTSRHPHRNSQQRQQKSADNQGGWFWSDPSTLEEPVQHVSKEDGIGLFWGSRDSGVSSSQMPRPQTSTPTVEDSPLHLAVDEAHFALSTAQKRFTELEDLISQKRSADETLTKAAVAVSSASTAVSLCSANVLELEVLVGGGNSTPSIEALLERSTRALANSQHLLACALSEKGRAHYIFQERDDAANTIQRAVSRFLDRCIAVREEELAKWPGR